MEMKIDCDTLCSLMTIWVECGTNDDFDTLLVFGLTLMHCGC